MSGDLIPVTSWSRNRQHLANAEDLTPDSFAGRSGRALCDTQTHADVFDQGWLDAKRDQWYGKPAGSQLIVNLPACRRCERKAAALEAVAE